MKLDPTLPWDTLFDRVLQSWKDSAYLESRRPFFANDVICEACFWDRYVSLGMACDEYTDHEWPHWMRHTLRESLIELRCALFDHLVDRLVANHRQALLALPGDIVVMDDGKAYRIRRGS